jgi:hypothetical protein
MPTSSEALLIRQKKSNNTQQRRHSALRKRSRGGPLVFKDKKHPTTQCKPEGMSGGTAVIDNSEHFDWLLDFPYW